jgi:hypothetical protein
MSRCAGRGQITAEFTDPPSASAFTPVALATAPRSTRVFRLVGMRILSRPSTPTELCKPIAPQTTNEVLIALSVGERDAVDRVCDAAASAGGQTNLRAPQDLGFMYVRTFQDLDGHVFEPMWMDPAGLPGGEAQKAG